MKVSVQNFQDMNFTLNRIYIELVVASVASVACPFNTLTADSVNAVISPNFLVWKFCGKTQFPQSFGPFIRKLGEITGFQEVVDSEYSRGNRENLPLPIQMPKIFCCNFIVFLESKLILNILKKTSLIA